LQNIFEKNFTKNLQKKTCAASVVQNFKQEENNPCKSIEINLLVSLQATLALTLCKLVQFCAFTFALVCVGINHQKGGD
jgi:hypothetical protein